jgi:hypothetical protein
MTVVLDDIRPKVRLELSDLPSDFASDSLVDQQVGEADSFLAAIRGDSVDDMAYELTVIALGSYFVYLAYTSLSEAQLGQLPPTASVRLRELKQKARMFINAFFDVDVDEQLNVNRDYRRVRPNAGGLSGSSLDD